MGMLGDIGRRLAMLMGSSRFDPELDEEMRLHLDLREARLRESGVPQAEARRAARRRFGNVRRLREESGEAWGWTWLEQTAQDIRIGVRTLVRNPAFTVAAVTTLALGIGANTALFTVVSGVILRPLPFKDPDRLVQVYGTTPLAPQGGPLSDVGELRLQNTSLEALVGYDVFGRFLREGGEGTLVRTVRTQPGFFQLLGVSPIRGRTIADGDPPNVAVLAEAFWRQRLGGDETAVGRRLILDDQSFTVVGVMPEAFQFPYSAGSLLPGVNAESRTDMWVGFDLPTTSRSRFSSVTGRLRPGVSVAAAQSELSALAGRLAQGSPNNRDRGVRVVPLAQAVVGTAVRRPLLVLFGAVGIVLALACANVANLLLVRMTLRTREIGVRSALGANRARLVRQFLTESLLLSMTGGVVGLALAWEGSHQLMRVAASQIPRAHEVGFDWRVFLFLLAACTITGAVLGVAPALFAARKDAKSALQEAGGRSTMSGGQRRLRDGLVVVEVALAFVLALGALLLTRELVRLRNTDMGMASRNVMTFHLGQRMIPRGRERPLASDVGGFYAIADRVAQLPGVRAAGFTQLLPLQNWGWNSNSSDFTRPGEPPRYPLFPIELRFVTPGYFQALGIPIKRGRGFTAADNRDAPGVILINETLARRYFGDADPTGTLMNRGTIVGVVGDVRQVNLDRTALPELYTPIAQNWSQVSELGVTLVVSTQDRPEALIDAVRAVVREVSPGHTIFLIKSMDRVVADSLADFTLYLSLMVLSAALALLLAVTGTYGVMSYVAASRSREFAIRAALGADRRRVSRLVLMQGLRVTGIGLGLGLFGALAAAPWLRGLPVSVRPPDVATVATVALLIAVVALVACLVPARRAAGSDPMSALRSE